jgi:DNA-binding beta-propeller fold protein YncE
VFAPDGTQLARWGKHGSTPGEVEAPVEVAVDGRGRVYILDQQLNRLSVFTSRGVFLVSIGAGGRRLSDFLHPTGLALDGAGGVYVADTGNDRIEKFEVQG